MWLEGRDLTNCANRGGEVKTFLNVTKHDVYAQSTYNSSNASGRPTQMTASVHFGTVRELSAKRIEESQITKKTKGALVNYFGKGQYI